MLPQKHPWFLLVTLNVTSVKDQYIAPEEILEIALAVVRTSDLEVQATLRELVKPRSRPELSPYCVKTTGRL